MHWIKTAEKRPKNGQEVLGAAADGTYCLLTYYEDSDSFINESSRRENLPRYIEYWIDKPVFPTTENRRFRFEQ